MIKCIPAADIKQAFIGARLLENLERRDPCAVSAAAVIVSATIDLAHNLGLQVTAEGVETEEHASLLKDLGCDVAQGYYFSRPLPGDQMTDWLGDRGVSQRPRLFGAGRMNGVLTDLPL